MTTLVTTDHGAWQRLYLVLRKARFWLIARRVNPAPPRESDMAIGRYAYGTANGEDARTYYETNGTRPVPQMLQHTPGAGSREYRHLFADTRLQDQIPLGVNLMQFANSDRDCGGSLIRMAGRRMLRPH